MLSGDSRQGDLRNHLVQSLIGSTGVQGQGQGLIDFTPAGIPLNAYQAGKDVGNKSYLDAITNLAMIPPIAKGSSGLIKSSAENAGGAMRRFLIDVKQPFSSLMNPSVVVKPSQKGMSSEYAKEAKRVYDTIGEGLPGGIETAQAKASVELAKALGMDTLPDHIKLTNPEFHSIDGTHPTKANVWHAFQVEGLDPKQKQILRKNGLGWEDHAHEYEDIRKLAESSKLGIEVDGNGHGDWVHYGKDKQVIKSGRGLAGLQQYIKKGK